MALYIGAAYQGARESDRTARAKRAENLRLFNEFRQMNPDATVSEMSAFAEQVSGGDNWLRGQLPTNKMLETMVATRERQRQQEMADRAFLENQRGRQARAWMQEDMAQLALSGADPLKAAEQLSQNPAYADQVKGMVQNGSFGGMFNAIANEQQMKLATEMYDAAIKYGKFDPSVVRAIGERSNASPSVIKAAVGMAEGQYRREQQERALAAQDRALTNLSRMLSIGKDIPPEAAREFFKSQGMSDEIIEPTVKLYEQEREIVINDKVASAVRGIVTDPLVMEALSVVGGDVTDKSIRDAVEPHIQALPESLRERARVEAERALGGRGKLYEAVTYKKQLQAAKELALKNFEEARSERLGKAGSVASGMGKLFGKDNKAAQPFLMELADRTGKDPIALIAEIQTNAPHVADLVKEGDINGAVEAYSAATGTPLRSKAEQSAAYVDALMSGVSKPRLMVEEAVERNGSLVQSAVSGIDEILSTIDQASDPQRVLSTSAKKIGEIIAQIDGMRGEVGSTSPHAAVLDQRKADLQSALAKVEAGMKQFGGKPAEQSDGRSLSLAATGYAGAKMRLESEGYSGANYDIMLRRELDKLARQYGLDPIAIQAEAARKESLVR